MNRDVVACAFAFVPNFLGYVSAKNWQNRMKSDKDTTTIKRVTFFSDPVYYSNNYYYFSYYSNYYGIYFGKKMEVMFLRMSVRLSVCMSTID